MRLITLEEHYRAPMLRSVASFGGGEPPPDSPMGRIQAKLDDVGEQRLADMDAGGVDMQILSHGAPGTEQLEAEEATRLASEANDYLASAIKAHPDRLAAFATLPTAAPDRAADELQRAVNAHGFKGALINGHVRGRFLDHRDFWPIFERAQSLNVPIYLHPTPPPDAVREVYYGGLAPRVAQSLSTAAWGWHVETGLHVLRLIAGGVFDEFPGLQVIVGHMGEALPFFLARTSRVLRQQAGLSRPLEDYVSQNFHFTTSGMFSYPPLTCLLEVIGADRVMLSVDYPYSSNEEGRDFILRAPISESDREKIAFRNAERLLGLDG
jgi:uncharacterized protein